MVTAQSVCRQCSSTADLGSMPGGGPALERMQGAVEVLLRGLGEDPTREGLVDTPRRVAKAWLDIASGCSQECTRAFGKALFHEPIVSTSATGMVVVRDITFSALSEQTLLPFHGRCHIAYAPRGGVILGLSKLARVTKCLASRLQQQEGFTQALMAAIQSEVAPHGVAVVVQANHLGARGGLPASKVTSAVSGSFQDASSGLLLEFLTLLRLSGIAAASTLLAGGGGGGSGVGTAAGGGGGGGGEPVLEHWEPAAASCSAQCTTSGPTVGEHPTGAAGVSRLDMAAAVKVLLEGVGEAPGRPGLKGSPECYVQWLFEATAGYHMALPPCCACSPESAAEGTRAAAAAKSLLEREGSPEAPATPADHSPDASCASSDMSADEPPPCCLGMPDEAAAATAQAGAECGGGEVDNAPGPAPEQALGGGQQQQQQRRQQQLAQQGRIRTFSAQFASQCEHHLLPFYGTLRLAYLPAGEGGGVGALGEAAAARQLQHIVEMFSKRLQVQERLSHQVADAALRTLRATAVLVVVDSAHMCMVARGVEKHASTTLTTASRGSWEEDAAARTAAMEVLLAAA